MSHPQVVVYWRTSRFQVLDIHVPFTTLGSQLKSIEFCEIKYHKDGAVQLLSGVEAWDKNEASFSSFLAGVCMTNHEALTNRECPFQIDVGLCQSPQHPAFSVQVQAAHRVRSFPTPANSASAVASRPKLDNQPCLFRSYVTTGLIKSVLACRRETHDSVVFLSMG